MNTFTQDFLSEKAIHPVHLIDGVDDPDTEYSTWDIVGWFGQPIGTSWVGTTYIIHLLMADGVLPTEVRHEFARYVALLVAHIWDTPVMTLDYLKYGEATLIDRASIAVGAEVTASDTTDNAVSQAAMMTFYCAMGDYQRAYGPCPFGLDRLKEIMKEHEV